MSLLRTPRTTTASNVCCAGYAGDAWSFAVRGRGGCVPSTTRVVELLEDWHVNDAEWFQQVKKVV